MIDLSVISLFMFDITLAVVEINSIEMVCLSGTLADDDSVCVAVPRWCVSYQILAVGTRSLALALMMMFTSNTNNLSQWAQNKANLFQLTPLIVPPFFCGRQIVN